jgi:hypothetical protein
MSSDITLYHGTIYEFDRIDVNRGRPNKDFGCGFYTSRTERHAVSIAERNRRIEVDRAAAAGRRVAVSAWVYTYGFDLREMDKLNVRQFETADRDWAEFILKNRRSRKLCHDYDMVIGPTANDDTNTVVGAMLLGLYGDPDSDVAMETFLRFIEPDRLPRQTFFATQRSADILRFVSRRAL